MFAVWNRPISVWGFELYEIISAAGENISEEQWHTAALNAEMAVSGGIETAEPQYFTATQEGILASNTETFFRKTLSGLF